MNMTRMMTVAFVLLVCMPVVSAHASGYIGLDRSSVTVVNESDDELEPDGLRVRIGVRISEFFDLEAQLGSGNDSRVPLYDKVRTTFAGAYLKGYLPLGRQSALFGLAGISGVEHTQTIDARDFSSDQGGFSYGFGLETQLTERVDLSADYMRYASNNGPFTDVSAVHLGIKWYF